MSGSRNPIWLAIATLTLTACAGGGGGGWRNHEWSMYTGMQPYHVGGNVQVSLPSSIDMNGNMQYSQHNVGIRNTAVGFAGIERRWEGRNHSLSMFAVANTQNQHQIALNCIWFY